MQGDCIWFVSIGIEFHRNRWNFNSTRTHVGCFKCCFLGISAYRLDVGSILLSAISSAKYVRTHEATNEHCITWWYYNWEARRFGREINSCVVIDQAEKVIIAKRVLWKTSSRSTNKRRDFLWVWGPLPSRQASLSILPYFITDSIPGVAANNRT